MAFGIDIRKPSVAGTFYPDNQQELIAQLKFFFDNTKILPEKQKLRALILPHAGYIYSGQTAAWGLRQLPKIDNSHFVMIGPAHYFQFDGIVASESNIWETPLGQVKHIAPVNIENEIKMDERAHNPEHSLEVQIPFLQYLFDSFSISAFLTGFTLDVEKNADYFIKNYKNSIFLISSDLSHYLSKDQAEEKDKKTIESILNFNTRYLLQEENTACGANGISTLIKIAEKLGWHGKLIKYETSASASGETDRVVGYASIGFYQ